MGNTAVAQTALGCPFVVQLLSHVRLFATAWTAARQASPSFTFFWSLLKFMSIESVMPSNRLTLCHPLLLLSSMFPNESVLRIRWSKYWSFSISISPYNEYSGLISFNTVPCISTKSFLSFSFIFWVISTEGFILKNTHRENTTSVPHPELDCFYFLHSCLVCVKNTFLEFVFIFNSFMVFCFIDLFEKKNLTFPLL